MGFEILERASLSYALGEPVSIEAELEGLLEPECDGRRDKGAWAAGVNWNCRGSMRISNIFLILEANPIQDVQELNGFCRPILLLLDAT